LLCEEFIAFSFDFGIDIVSHIVLEFASHLFFYRIEEVATGSVNGQLDLFFSGHCRLRVVVVVVVSRTPRIRRDDDGRWWC
jgi:hypothetical protein